MFPPRDDDNLVTLPRPLSDSALQHRPAPPSRLTLPSLFSSMQAAAPRRDSPAPLLHILTACPNRVAPTLDPSLCPRRTVTPLQPAGTLAPPWPIDTRPWPTWIACLAQPIRSQVNIPPPPNLPTPNAFLSGGHFSDQADQFHMLRLTLAQGVSRE